MEKEAAFRNFLFPTWRESTKIAADLKSGSAKYADSKSLGNSNGPRLEITGRRPNGFLGLSLNDTTILFLVTLIDKIASEG